MRVTALRAYRTMCVTAAENCPISLRRCHAANGDIIAGVKRGDDQKR